MDFTQNLGLTLLIFGAKEQVLISSVMTVQIPLLGFTGIVKGTGLFFAGVAGVYAVWRLFQNARETGGKRGRRMAVCLPAALLTLAGAAAPAVFPGVCGLPHGHLLPQQLYPV